MSINQWKLLNQLRDTLSKFSNDKSLQNVLGKDLSQLVQKVPTVFTTSELTKHWEYYSQKYKNSTVWQSLKSAKTVDKATTNHDSVRWKKPIVSEWTITSHTDHVIFSLETAENDEALLTKLESFIDHIKQYPEGRNSAIKMGAIRFLLRLRSKTENEEIKGAVREALALLGFSDPVPGRGVRILSMDGGGIRGLLVLEMLKKLEEMTGKPTHELFDLFCGVSTGAILSFSLGIHRKSIDEIAQSYKAISTEVFKQSALWGTGNLMWSHSYYDSSLWEKRLKESLGTTSLIGTARDPMCPKMCAVSAVVNQSHLAAFVFRNYSLPWRVKSQYFGSNLPEVWQAARASAAAPTIFEEFKLGNFLHQDGGILVNNPTAVAVHEAKLIWPDTPIQCVVSFGTGRSVPSPSDQAQTLPGKIGSTSWANKLYTIIDSATDTEGVHIMLTDLLPQKIYYRFNPYLTEMISMVEIDDKKLQQLERDAIMYLRRNEDKFQEAAKALTSEKTLAQKAKDYIKYQRCFYGI